MSSRFVAAGAHAEPVSNEAEWEKARQKIESQRHTAPAVKGQQEDGRSLYEVLEANKAAKQEAFEEASKLRNQFRPLDDSEIEFLDAVRQSEREKEISVKAETAEQIEQFRKQRAAAEQKSTGLDHDVEGDSRQLLEKESWTTSKKRRRDRIETETSVNKLKRTFRDDKEIDSTPQVGVTTHERPASSSQQGKAGALPLIATGKAAAIEKKTTPPTKPSLVSYDSSDDD